MNIQLLTRIILSVGTSCLILSACGESKKQFTIEGKVNNANEQTLYLEQRSISNVAILDSVKLSNSGEFIFKQNEIGYPEFFRLRLGDQTINFAVDSSETLKITTDKSNFATKYEVEGSHSSILMRKIIFDQAELSQDITRFEKEHNNKTYTDAQYSDSVVTAVNRYKTMASELILTNYLSPAAYFALFQKVGDYLIFDPSDKKDLRLFQAIATVWETYRAESPRTAQMKTFTLSALAARKSEEQKLATIDKINSGEIAAIDDYFNISLPDINNKTVEMSSLKGKIVLLDFTVYNSEASPAHNIRLNKLYENNKSKMEIYQVSLDTDKHAWMNTASNLPWTCVRDAKGRSSELLNRFNVEILPVTYILDSKGDIVKKVGPNEDLAKELAKVL